MLSLLGLQSWLSVGGTTVKLQTFKRSSLAGGSMSLGLALMRCSLPCVQPAVCSAIMHSLPTAASTLHKGLHPSELKAKMNPFPLKVAFVQVFYHSERN